MIEITQDMERVFNENPLYCKDGQGQKAKVIARCFIPGTFFQWLITEASMENGQWILYGYCHIFVWEWGYISLVELMGINTYGQTISAEVFQKDAQRSVESFL